MQLVERQRLSDPIRVGVAPIVVGVVAIAIADLTAASVAPSIGAWGVLDESAHAATALIVLAAFGRVFRRRTVLAVLAGGVALDLDHVPGLLGLHFLDNGTPRPYTHSLLGLAVAFVVALALARRFGPLAFAAWVAVVVHIWRDLAEPNGPGVSLLWPASDHAFAIGYLWYCVPLALAASVAILRRVRSRLAQAGT